MVGVRISNLTHEFDDREVFQALNYEFDGACLAITGPNGSGKSTLLRMLSSLLTPTSGEASITIDGADVPRETIRRTIGLSAPDVRLYAELTARENLRFILQARGCADIEVRALSALEEIGLADRADDPVRELSSGLRQRAALAAAIAHDPMVLLLDEPSTNLDEPGIAVLHTMIARRSQKGLVVIATNNADEAALGADRLVLGGLR